MELSLVVTLIGVLATICGIGVTVALFIISGIKQDIKDSHASFSKSHTSLWETVNSNRESINGAVMMVRDELSEFKEYVAVSYTREERVNEKMEVNRQHIDQALSGISHRLQKLETDQDQVIKGMENLGQYQKESITILTQLLQEKKNNG